MPERGWNLGYTHVLLDELWNIHAQWANLWAVFIYFYISIHQVFIPYWNFEYTKAVTLHCGKSGRWHGLRFCSWIDFPWVNQPPFSFSVDIYKSHPTCTVTFNLWLPTQTFRQELPKVNSHLFVQWDKVYSDEPQGWYLAKVISLSSDGTVTVLYRKGKTLETFNLFEINWFQPQEMANGIFLTPLYSHNHTTKHSKTLKVKGFADDLCFLLLNERPWNSLTDHWQTPFRSWSDTEAF